MSYPASCGSLPKQYLFRMRQNFLSHLPRKEDLPQGGADRDPSSTVDRCVEKEVELPND